MTDRHALGNPVADVYAAGYAAGELAAFARAEKALRELSRIGQEEGPVFAIAADLVAELATNPPAGLQVGPDEPTPVGGCA